MNELLKTILNTETILQALLVVMVLGFGFWFDRKCWPWLTKILERRQELGHTIQMRQIDTEAESDRRWQESTTKLADNFASLRGELEAFRAQQSAMVASIERLFRYLVRANGENNTDS